MILYFQFNLFANYSHYFSAASRLIEKAGLKAADIGTSQFITSLSKFMDGQNVEVSINLAKLLAAFQRSCR